MKEKIEETKAELEQVKKLKEEIFSKAKSWFESCDPSQIDAHEYGEIIDVVKDLSEMIKYCWESLYFQSVVKAMEEEHEIDEEMMRYGYNPNRYPSSGRYASRGSGVRMGYPMMEPEMWARRASERFGYPVYYDGEHSGMGDIMSGYGLNGMPGYTRGVRGDGSYPGTNDSSMNGDSNGSKVRYGYDMNPEYGRAYNMYKESRRHYTENKDQESKNEMTHHAEEHLKRSIETIKDIWKDVDPALKKKMKVDLQALVSEMNV